jgi:putative heme-binding domain-containing protein
VCIEGLLCATFFVGQENLRDEGTQPASLSGQRSFNTNCAGCHGLDGRGGDKASNIVANLNARNLSDAQVSGIITNGITGTSMPSFRHLGTPQIRRLVAYVRTLQGKMEVRKLPGDAGRGKEIFFGKGECSSCHAISGEGGFLGPDLSAYGSVQSAKAIRDEIVRTERTDSAGYRSAVVSTRQGDRLEGVIRNEDNFSIQVQTNDGSFHFLQKSDLQNIERLGRSPMPTNYGNRLTSAELNDLVSFLMDNDSTPNKSRTSEKNVSPSE